MKSANITTTHTLQVLSNLLIEVFSLPQESEVYGREKLEICLRRLATQLYLLRELVQDTGEMSLLERLETLEKHVYDDEIQKIKDGDHFKQPQQPIIDQGNNQVYKSNQVIEHIWNESGLDFSFLDLGFPKEDVNQFYQLLGISTRSFNALTRGE